MIESGKTIEHMQQVGPYQAPIRTVETKKGLAVGCNESHPLRIEIEGVRTIEGELSIYLGSYCDSYTVLLDSAPSGG